MPMTPPPTGRPDGRRRCSARGDLHLVRRGNLYPSQASQGTTHIVAQVQAPLPARGRRGDAHPGAGGRRPPPARGGGGGALVGAGGGRVSANLGVREWPN